MKIIFVKKSLRKNSAICSCNYWTFENVTMNPSIKFGSLGFEVSTILKSRFWCFAINWDSKFGKLLPSHLNSTTTVLSVDSSIRGWFIDRLSVTIIWLLHAKKPLQYGVIATNNSNVMKIATIFPASFNFVLLFRFIVNPFFLLFFLFCFTKVNFIFLM